MNISSCGRCTLETSFIRKVANARKEDKMIARIKKTGELIDVIPYGDEFQLFPEGDFKFYTKDELDFRVDVELMKSQEKVKALRQEVAEINKEREYWQQVRIQAAISAMPIVADDGYNVRNEQHLIAKYAVELADALVAELRKGGE